MLVSGKGPVDPNKYDPNKKKAAPGAGGGADPFGGFDFGSLQFSYDSPVKKTFRGMGTEDFAPLIAMEVSGTICDVNDEGKRGKVNPSSREVIQLLKDCGCRVAACSTDPDANGFLFDGDLDIEEFDPLSEVEAVVWDRQAAGCSDDNRWNDLPNIMELMPDCEARRRLKEKIEAKLSNHKYGWVGLPMPEHVAKIVRDTAAGIDPAHLAIGGIESEPHVTILYGLTGDNVSDVAECCKRMGRPTMVFGNVTVSQRERRHALEIRC